mmetsp:Transcript_107905/g.315479  ORF Transcript_107905/g.315479 Transcript_107905/m.315479 type:complete len:247 (-) Transcript_107905:817-1557(-)
MSFLTFAKGSAATWLASEVRRVLLSLSPRAFSSSATCRCTPASPGCLPFCAARNATCLSPLFSSPLCTSAGGAAAWSAASASTSIASKAAGLCATASASRTLTPRCTKRTVAAEVLPATKPWTMPMAAVSAESSSCRVRERWSQVLALSEHMRESSPRYCWSSRSVADVTDRSWLCVAISSWVLALSLLALSRSRFFCFRRFSFSWTSASCAATALTSSASTVFFSSVKSLRRSSRVAVIWFEWYL